MKLTITIIGVVFWASFILYDVMRKDKSCKPDTKNMYCPKDVKLAKGEIMFYHTILISALAFCFVIGLHIIYILLSHLELSILMMMTSSIIIGLFTFSHADVENFSFHCLGLVIGVYGANAVIFTHLLSIYWKNRRLMAETDDSDEDPVDFNTADTEPETIEMRNNQPGSYYDINTGTHIYNFERV